MNSKVVFNRQARNKLAESICSFFDDYRLYYHMLSRMKRVQDSKVPTMGVGFTGDNVVTLFYNPEFTESLNMPQMMVMLDHECQHVARRHLTRGKSVSDRMLANISMDIVINADIPALHTNDMKDLRAMVITGDKFPELNGKILRDMTWEQIYEILKPNWDKQKQAFKEKFKDMIANHDKWENGGGGSGGEIEMPSLSPAQQAALDDLIKESIRDLGGRSPGNMPGTIKRMVSSFLRVRTNWKSILSLFAQTVSKDDKDSTWKKYNRRLGEASPGSRKEYKPNLLSVVDNSGSIGEREYNAAMSHMLKIAETVGSVDGIGVDTTVNFEYEFKRGQVPSFEDLGSGGGTDFQPAFDYAKAKAKYDGIIYFTDGYADHNIDTYGLPVIFAIFANGIEVKGHRNIKIDEQDDEY